MISLKRYLLSREDNPFFRTTELLLEAIGVHAVMVEPEEYDRFRDDIQALVRQLNHDPIAEALVVSGAAIQALAEYNQRVSRIPRMRQAELQSIVTMLTDTIKSLSTAGAASLSRLQDIERRLEKASEIEDMRALKIHLADCLKGLQMEQKRQAAVNQVQVAALRSELRRNEQALRAEQVVESLDLLTGLPSRPAAEEALSACCEHGAGTYAVAFVVERIMSINTRFGHAAGDQVITLMGDHLKRSFSVDDRLYRWTGPSFLLILKREQLLAEVRAEVVRSLSVRLEKTLEIGKRSVLLPVSASWAVYPLENETGAEPLIEKIEVFVRSRNLDS